MPEGQRRADGRIGEHDGRRGRCAQPGQGACRACGALQRGGMAIALEELRIAAAADSRHPLTYSLFGLVDMGCAGKRAENFERARDYRRTTRISTTITAGSCAVRARDRSIKYFMQAVSNRSIRRLGARIPQPACARCAEQPERRTVLPARAKREPDEPGSLLQWPRSAARDLGGAPASRATGSSARRPVARPAHRANRRRNGIEPRHAARRRFARRANTSRCSGGA